MGAVKQDNSFVWVRIADAQSGSRLVLFTLFHDVDAPLSDRLTDAVSLFVEQEIAEGIESQVELLSPVTLDDGSQAERADITHPGEIGTVLHRIQVARRASFTYALVLTTRLDDLPLRQETCETILSSLTSFTPAIYGIGHDRAFIMLLGEPNTMDPALARETTSHFFVNNVFSGLVRFDSDLSVAPDLAEGWEVDETGTVYTFTLREGITFHDGRPITADDFKYSIERASDPELHSDTALLYLGDIMGMREKLEGEAAEVAGVEVVNESTLRITIDLPKRYFLAKLTYPSSAVIDRRAVEELGEEWSMAEDINGSGPYRLESWEPVYVVVLQRYEDYHTPANLEYLVSPLRALPGARGLDMYLGEAWDAVNVGLGSLDFVRDHPELSRQLHEFDQLTSYFVEMDGTRPPFDDPKVRRAFAMALDRERLIKGILEGNARFANGLLPPGMPGYSESLRGIPYDPEMARQLLAESRYADDLPEIIFTAVDYDGEPSSMVQFMVDSWKESLGVEVKVDLVDADAYYYDLENVGEHLYTYGWVADYPDPENFLDLLLHSEAHDARYINKDFDVLVERARVEGDPESRLALYRAAEQLLMDDAGIIPPFHVRDYVLVRPHVEGFRMLPVGQPDLTSIKLNPIQPTAPPTSTIVDQLRKNAEEFEYSIGGRGGSLTQATISEPLTFNLAIAKDASSSGVLGYLFEGLTETSWLTDEIEPALAESWERSEDGLTWTLNLRRDVTWHDGQPFTAHDVDFTFNRIIYNHDIPASSRPSFHFRYLDEQSGEWKEAPMSVTALDNHTVQCVLPVPFAPFLRSMGASIYPKHILEKHVDDGTFASTWDIEADPSEIIGTGPFTIGRYDPGERVVMQRNPDYWLKDDAGNSLPYLDEIVHVIVQDLEAELAKFLAGESDIHGVLGEELADLELLQEEGKFTIYRRGPAFGTTFMGFNMNPGSSPDTGEPYLAPEKLKWFQNRQFRQAVAHSIDKDTIINDVQHGIGYRQWASISPAAGDFHNPNVRRYEYDLDRANEILDGIGWTDTDGDGIREDDEGNDIAFSLVTNTGNNVRTRVGAIVHRGMTKIGLDVDYSLVEFGDLVFHLTDSYDWEALIIGFTGGPDPHGGITFWHSGEGLHLWYPNQPRPGTEWEAEIDELYVKASQELDRDQRVGYYHRAQEIAAENVPVIYTTLSERLSAVRNVFGNTTPTLYGLWDTRYLYRTDL